MIFLDQTFWSTFITSLIGSGGLSLLIVRGLGKHLGDRLLETKKHDLELALESHRHELNKSLEAYRVSLEESKKALEGKYDLKTYATQIHFDERINAIKNIFTQLGKLRLRLNGLRQPIAHSDAEQRSNEFVRKVGECKGAVDSSAEAVETVRIMLDDGLYLKVSTCIEIAIAEIAAMEINPDQRFTPAWSMTREVEFGRFSKALDAATVSAKGLFPEGSPQ